MMIMMNNRAINVDNNSNDDVINGNLIEKVEVCKEIMEVAQQRKFVDLHYV